MKAKPTWLTETSLTLEEIAGIDCQIVVDNGATHTIVRQDLLHLPNSRLL